MVIPGDVQSYGCRQLLKSGGGGGGLKIIKTYAHITEVACFGN